MVPAPAGARRVVSGLAGATGLARAVRMPVGRRLRPHAGVVTELRSYLLAIAVTSAAVLFVGALAFYGARQFSGRAADTRAANEAASFAAHSSALATGDAFDGYIQILRFAEDPIVRSKATSANDRTAAMQQLLYLNVNKFTSLTVADRGGLILATTDSSISGMKNSPAFADTRANLGPANSDIILPEAGKHGYVEYISPLKDADGTVWAVLLARADPARVWKGTLAASVDAGRNVIINSEGQYAAGVPDELLRQQWRGVPMGNGSVRADIAGVDSICGLAPIGRDTQIDRGLNVASCLPASLIQAERSAATDKQLLVTLAAAVFAIAVSAALLKLVIHGDDTAGAKLAERVQPVSDITAERTSMVLAPETVMLDSEGLIEPGAEAVLEAPDVARSVPEGDALTLIEAYERRNARLAERLRETVQARLMIATTQANEAYRLAGTGAIAGDLHRRAMTELEAIREHELRAIRQELYPALVRIGLPAALRSLRKELADVIDMRIDAEASVDSVEPSGDRTSLNPALRLMLYRFAADSARALAGAGSSHCTLMLRRHDDQLSVLVSSPTPIDGASIDESAIGASALTVALYGGVLTIDDHEGGDVISISLTLDVPPLVVGGENLGSLRADASETRDAVGSADVEPLEDPDSVAARQPLADVPTDEEEDPQVIAILSTLAAVDAEYEMDDAEPDDGDANDGDAERRLADEPDAPEADDTAAGIVKVIATANWRDAHAAIIESVPSGLPLEPERPLRAALEAVQAEMFGSVVVSLEIADGLGDEPTASTALRSQVMELIRRTLIELRQLDARVCRIELTRPRGVLTLRLTSDTRDGEFGADVVDEHRAAIASLGGEVAFTVEGDAVELAMTLPAGRSKAA